MKYILIPNDEGQYINKDEGKRYDVLECHEAIGPRADEFVEFENLQEALDFWHLTEVSQSSTNEM